MVVVVVVVVVSPPLPPTPPTRIVAGVSNGVSVIDCGGDGFDTLVSLFAATLMPFYCDVSIG